MYILCCNKCGKMYKAEKQKDIFITDFGDELENCLLCKGDFTIINTYDWVADLVFTIKGER